MAKSSAESVHLQDWARQVVDIFPFLWGSALAERTKGAVLAEVTRRVGGFKVTKTAGFLTTLVSLAWFFFWSLLFQFLGDGGNFSQDAVVNLAAPGFFGSLIGVAMMLWSWLLWNPSKQSEWDSTYDEVHRALWTEIRRRREYLVNSDNSRSNGKPPQPMPMGVSHRGAETLCAEWMRFLGESEVTVTRATADGGIDIESSLSVAQVKNYSGSVGVAALRELTGVSKVDGRRPMFFTSGTYTQGAADFADKADVYLFIYSAENGTLDAANKIAAERLNHLSQAHPTSAVRQEPDFVRPAPPRVRTAPAHCPKCDYAPAPEEIRCSECGFYFLLNRF